MYDGVSLLLLCQAINVGSLLAITKLSARNSVSGQVIYGTEPVASPTVARHSKVLSSMNPSSRNIPITWAQKVKPLQFIDLRTLRWGCNEPSYGLTELNCGRCVHTADAWGPAGPQSLEQMSKCPQHIAYKTDSAHGVYDMVVLVVSVVLVMHTWCRMPPFTVTSSVLPVVPDVVRRLHTFVCQVACKQSSLGDGLHSLRMIAS